MQTAVTVNSAVRVWESKSCSTSVTGGFFNVRSEVWLAPVLSHFISFLWCYSLDKNEELWLGPWRKGPQTKSSFPESCPAAAV